jgi:two-component system, NtrC family, sensor kinase
MKKKILVLICWLIGISVSGQYDFRQHQIDSLTQLLATSEIDQVKIDALFWLGQLNQFDKPSKAEKYLNEGLELTRKIKSKEQIAGYLVSLGFFYGNIGQPAKGIELLHESLLFFEETNGDKSMTYAFLANNYEAQGDLDNALDFARKSYQIYENRLLENLPVDIRGYPAGPMRMGQLFGKVGKLDSAMYYAQKAYQRILERPLEGMEFFYCEICNLLGNVHSRQNRPTEALQFYRLAHHKAIEINSPPSIRESQLGLAKYYALSHQPDSAIYFATKAYEGAQAINRYDIMQSSAGLLRSVYEKNGEFKKALYFNDLAVAAHDSVSGADKVREVQNLTFREERRQDKMKQEAEAAQAAFKNKLRFYFFLVILTGLLLVAFILYRNNHRKQKANIILESTLSNLKATQTQLIQSEKMASLGELTAGIAHEIQNPLNFVNNFSEVSRELVDEMKEELAAGSLQGAAEIADDLTQNLAKINHHGRRAADIVKGMLQHSRTSSGQKEPTDINALCDEYLRLAYHGLRAKDKSFNANFETNFDESVGKLNIIPQDMGRVVLNLINNAFYTVRERVKLNFEGYEPTVTVSTKKEKNNVIISVADNGLGIPDHIKDKIFQPFFTTKPTGQGTGLGLSLAYDIVKAHGGEIKVSTKEEGGTAFIIQLPLG